MEHAQNTAEQDKVLARIRKLLALANDAAASEGERDNAMRMAHATLAKHGLSMAEAEAAGQTAERRGEERDFVRNQPWTRQVAHAVAKLFFCRFYFERGGRAPAGKVGLVFVGRLSNAVTAKEVAVFVIKSIQSEANREWKKQADPGPWWTSFCKGAADKVSERCEQMRREAERQSQGESTGRSLVLASYYRQEHDANEAWLAAQGTRLRTVKSREKRAGEGYGAGASFGSKVSLNRQVGGTPNNLKRLA